MIGGNMRLCNILCVKTIFIGMRCDPCCFYPSLDINGVALSIWCRQLGESSEDFSVTVSKIVSAVRNKATKEEVTKLVSDR